MRRRRFTVALLLFILALLVFAPGALAHSDSGGQGWYGETNDTDITNAMFITILFFPVIIILFSLIQSRLHKREHTRTEAAKRRAASADWRGGW
jgi:hypothetical protein